MISDGEAAISVGFENTQGYKDALQDACRDGGTLYLQDGIKSDQVYGMLKEKVDLNRKTLIYVASPGQLQVVYQALRNYPDYMGLFPDTLGLVGFDVEGWTRMTSPAISAIITPAYQEGVRAMEELIDVLDGKKREGDVVFKNIVKWRGTTLLRAAMADSRGFRSMG